MNDDNERTMNYYRELAAKRMRDAIGDALLRVVGDTSEAIDEWADGLRMRPEVRAECMAAASAEWTRLFHLFDASIHDRRVMLGRVNVDSGRLLLADPSHIQSNPHGLDAACETLVGAGHAVPALDGLGLLFTAGLGDGVYDVFGTVGPVTGAAALGERIKRVDVVLIENDSDNAEIERLAGTGGDAEARQRLDAAERDSDLVGYVLGQYRRLTGKSCDQLAEWLGTNIEGLASLSEETRPRIVGRNLELHPELGLDQLADLYGADRGRLLEAFEHGSE